MGCVVFNVYSALLVGWKSIFRFGSKYQDINIDYCLTITFHTFVLASLYICFNITQLQEEESVSLITVKVN